MTEGPYKMLGKGEGQVTCDRVVILHCRGE